MVFGFFAALLWPGPATPPGLAGVTKIPLPTKVKEWDGAPGADNSHLKKSI